MSLHVTVGYDGTGTNAVPTVIYAGNSRAAALAAEEASNAVRFERLSNVTGVRKNNPRHVPVEGTSQSPIPPVTSESVEGTSQSPIPPVTSEPDPPPSPPSGRRRS